MGDQAVGTADTAGGDGLEELAAAVDTVRRAADEISACLPHYTAEQVRRLSDLVSGLTRVGQAMTRDVVATLSDRSSKELPAQERMDRRLGCRSPEEAAKELLGIQGHTVSTVKRFAEATEPGRTAEANGGGAPSLTLMGRAQAAREISLEQVAAIQDALLPVRGRARASVLARAEALLVGCATGGRFGSMPAGPRDAQGFAPRMSPDALRRLAREVAESVDTAAPEQTHEAVSSRRGFSLREGRHGAPSILTVHLMPEAAALIDQLMSSILDPRTRTGDDGTSSETGSNPEASAAYDVVPTGPERTGAADRGAVGGGGTGVDLLDGVFAGDARTYSQKQHDAFFELLRRSVGSAPLQRGDRPHLIVVARAEQLVRALNRTPDSEVESTVAEAVTALAAAGRAGRLTDASIAVINGLIDLLNDGEVLRRDSVEEAYGVTDSGGSGCDEVGSDEGRRLDFGGSVLGDPRLSRAALLPATGRTIPLTSLAGIICDGVVSTVMTKGGEFLSYSADRKRLYDKRQRQVLVTQYQTCAVPGCSVRGIYCDAHHVEWVSRGGATTVANGILLCFFHHQQLHDGFYEIVPRQPGLDGLEARRTEHGERTPFCLADDGGLVVMDDVDSMPEWARPQPPPDSGSEWARSQPPPDGGSPPPAEQKAGSDAVGADAPENAGPPPAVVKAVGVRLFSEEAADQERLFEVPDVIEGTKGAGSAGSTESAGSAGSPAVVDADPGAHGQAGMTPGGDT